MNNNSIKLALLNIGTLSSTDIIKNAGPINHLKNLWRGFRDQEYKNSIESVKQQFKPNQKLIHDLGEAIEKVEQAIKDLDLEAYKEYFDDIQQLSKQLTIALSADSTKEKNKEFAQEITKKEIREVAPLALQEQSKKEQEVVNDIEPKTIKKEISKEEILDKPQISRRHYTTEELRNDPSVVKELERQLQRLPDHDVSFGHHNQDLLSFKWFQQFTADDIILTAGGLNILLQKIKTKVKIEKLFNPEDFDKLIKDSAWLPEFLQKFKTAVLNGKLLDYKAPEATEKIKKRPVNQNKATVRTEEFLLPQTIHHIQMTIILVDMMSSRDQSKQLRYAAVEGITLRPGSAALAKNIEIRNKLLKLSRTKDYIDKVIEGKGQNIPRKAIGVSKLQFAEILKQGYKLAFGKEPSIQTLGVGWAQGALESSDTKGSGKIILPCGNVGNIKADDTWVKGGNKYFTMDTKELDQNKESYVHQGAKWRAYNSPEEGAAYYWKLLAKKNGVLDAMSQGDPIGTATALKKGKYFTDDLKHYSGSMGSLYKTFWKEVAPSFGYKEQTVNDYSNASSINNTYSADLLIKELFSEFEDNQKIMKKSNVNNNQKCLLKIGNHLQNSLIKIALAEIINQNNRIIFGSNNIILINKLNYNQDDIFLQCNYNVKKSSLLKLAHVLQLNYFNNTKSLITVTDVTDKLKAKNLQYLNPDKLVKSLQHHNLQLLINQ